MAEKEEAKKCYHGNVQAEVSYDVVGEIGTQDNTYVCDKCGLKLPKDPKPKRKWN
jgi:hypothetical protein